MLRNILIAFTLFITSALAAANDATKMLEEASRQAFGNEKGGFNTYMLDERINSVRAALNVVRRASETGQVQGLQVPMDSFIGAAGQEGMNPDVHKKNMDEFRKQLELRSTERLYIFISLAMPENLLREYQLDAAITGAELVLRGAPKGMNLQDLQTKLIDIFGRTGVQAPINIDPRLFDAYSVSLVPTIVFAESESLDLPCFDAVKCQELDYKQYEAIQGGVSLKFALEEFERRGAPTQPYLKLIKEFYGANPDEDESRAAKGRSKDDFSAMAELVFKRNVELLGYQPEHKTFLEYLDNSWARKILQNKNKAF